MGRTRSARRRAGTGWIEGLALGITCVAIILVALPRWTASPPESARDRCQRDLEALRDALGDTLFELRGRIHAESLPRTFLGDGEPPVFAPPELGPRAALGALPILRDTGGSSALPPELTSIDPWGHAYVVRVHRRALRVSNAWLLSAGPDGVIETEPFHAAPGGDDLGLLAFPALSPTRR